MNAGKLRHRITLQSPPTAQDGYNQPTGNWTDVTTIWASVEPLSGRTLFAAQAMQSEITHKISLRYTASIDPFMRVKFGTRTFRIISLINFEERNIELQLMCVEVWEG